MQSSPLSQSINNFPQITPAQKRRVLAGVRPFRKGGIRLQKQKIQDKTIIHNYGHGGAGISLAPATAQEAATLAISECKKGEQVSVLGCGLIGLMTALSCAQRGLKVSIYAQRIPKYNQSKVTIMSTSQVAPGYWLPYHYEYADQKEHDRRSEISYNKYLQWMKKTKSIRKAEVYQDMNIQQIKLKAPPYISETCKPITLNIGKKSFSLINFQTAQIHLQLFLQEILLICQQKGVKLEKRSFNSTADVCKLPTKVIINCLGLGSKKVFGDNKVYGVKGHLLQIKNTTKIKGIYGFKFEDQPVKLYCFDDKILIGLTKEDVEHTQINTELAKTLENRAYSFYNSLGLNNSDPKPKL